MIMSYKTVTEVSGELVTREQIQRMYNRYKWAAKFCTDKDVLEIACGSGQGSGIISKSAASYVGVDVSNDLIDIARQHYGNRVNFLTKDVFELDYDENTFDVVIIFEALYYLKCSNTFFDMVNKWLRVGGVLLIVTANKDLYDFNPSPFSIKYLGARELYNELRKLKFNVRVYGDTPVSSMGYIEKFTRPLKKVAAQLKLVPSTAKGKLLLKKIIFGGLFKMPYELNDSHGEYIQPKLTPVDLPDLKHKVLYCLAEKTNVGTTL